jgi:hypothetical protein
MLYSPKSDCCSEAPYGCALEKSYAGESWNLVLDDCLGVGDDVQGYEGGVRPGEQAGEPDVDKRSSSARRQDSVQ